LDTQVVLRPPTFSLVVIHTIADGGVVVNTFSWMVELNATLKY